MLMTRALNISRSAATDAASACVSCSKPPLIRSDGLPDSNPQTREDRCLASDRHLQVVHRVAPDKRQARAPLVYLECGQVFDR